jgi:extracellular factor (EF) 3-hydroxypalmitic acid methyl ester biosynthesis protein
MQLMTSTLATDASSTVTRAADAFDVQMRRIDTSYRDGRLERERAATLINDAATTLETWLQRFPLDTAELGELSIRVREQTARWFMRSRVHARAYSKPRGYAGDYHTMELLYEGSPAGQGWVGPVLDAWVLERRRSRT